MWALLPALLKLRLKVDDVVTTLLLNSIMLYGVMALLEGPWKDPTAVIPTRRVSGGGGVPYPRRLRAPSRRVVALVAAIVVWWAMGRTTLGFSIRAAGANPRPPPMPAYRSGAIVLLAAAMSGALAGLAGAGEVGGVRFQVTSDLSSGYGYAGIVIATLAELNPLGVVPAALFFAIIFNGAGTMSRTIGVPIYLADVIQGIALLMMVAGRLFTVYRLRVAAMPDTDHRPSTSRSSPR